jgi:hypothetical protein
MALLYFEVEEITHNRNVSELAAVRSTVTGELQDSVSVPVMPGRGHGGVARASGVSAIDARVDAQQIAPAAPVRLRRRVEHLQVHQGLGLSQQLLV